MSQSFAGPERIQRGSAPHPHCTQTQTDCVGHELFVAIWRNYANKSQTVQDTTNGQWRQEVCTCRWGIPSQPPPFCPPTGRLTAWATTRGDMPAPRGAHLPHSPHIYFHLKANQS